MPLPLIWATQLNLWAITEGAWRHNWRLGSGGHKRNSSGIKVHWFTLAAGTQTSCQLCRVQRRTLGLPEQVPPGLRDLRAARTQHPHLTKSLKEAFLGWLSVLHIRNYTFKHRKLIPVLWTIKWQGHRTATRPSMAHRVFDPQEKAPVVHPWTALWIRRILNSELKLMMWNLGGQSYIWFHVTKTSSR